MPVPTPKSEPQRGDKRYGRSRMSSDPMAVRAPGRSAHSRRVRGLFAGYARKLAPDDVVGAAAALRCAELTAASEDLRWQIMNADLSQADDAKLAIQAKLAEQMIRLENLSDRSERRLARLVGEAPEVDQTTLFFEQIAAKARREEAEAEAKPIAEAIPATDNDEEGNDD